MIKEKSKENQYFSHDKGARNDPKLIAVLMEMGLSGIGLYWCLVEMLHEQGGYLPKEYANHAFNIRCCTASEVEKLVEKFGLFEFDEERFWSNSGLRRIADQEERKRLRVEAGRRGGLSRASNAQADFKQNPSNAQAMLNLCLSGAQAINKEINKKINKEINNYTPEGVLNFVYRTFLFLNITGVLNETERFCKWHNGRKWADIATEEQLREAVCRWTPTNGNPRVSLTFLNMWQEAYNELQDSEMIDERVCWKMNFGKAEVVCEASLWDKLTTCKAFLQWAGDKQIKFIKP